MNGETALVLPWLLTGIGFRLDPLAGVFLPFTALLWLAAGLYARHSLSADSRRRRFFAFSLATMAGNLALIAARDMVGFYLCFAVMTFSAYGLIIHTGTDSARRAGRIYIILAMFGEAMIVSAMFLIAASAESTDFAHLPAAMAASPHQGLIVALVLAGFGIKAGIVPLHVWLPLAHPVAPIPASAVLSGVIIKAGLLGWIRFLPLGEIALPGYGALCLGLGLGGALYGVLAGLGQREAKTVLAYSSISQMGLLLAILGPGLADPGAWPLSLVALCLGSLHHALNKGALFLGTGLAATAPPGQKKFVLAGLLPPALALAGAPLTSGAAAKAAGKAALAAGIWPQWPLWLLPLTSIATTLLMVRFLVLVRAATRGKKGKSAVAGLWLAWLPVLFSATAAGFLFFPGQTGETPSSPFSPAGLLTALWPVAAGLALARLLGLFEEKAGSGGGRIPAGDLLALVVGVCAAAARRRQRLLSWWEQWGKNRGRQKKKRPETAMGEKIALRLEQGLGLWKSSGVFFLLLVLLFYLLLGTDSP